MAERQVRKETLGPGETNTAPLTMEQFRASPEFSKFTKVMRRILRIPKIELDYRVREAKLNSPRFGDPNAPGRKVKDQ